jgi:hypothetical protein
MSATSGPVKARAINCPNCGGNVEIRGFAHTLTAVCGQCLSVLDTSTPNIRILRKFSEKMQRFEPLLPLGHRGRYRDVLWEVIGFQVRGIKVESSQYLWHEYLLFNPFHGFRYITQYDGHWSWVTTLKALPGSVAARGRRGARFGGVTYAHFQTAQARTEFVLGEFPWAVRVGEQVECKDYIHPPYMLSSEGTEKEIAWSQGEYIPGAGLWRDMQFPGAPPEVRGIYSTQPSPHAGKVKSAWVTALLLLAAWFGVLIYFGISAANKEVFRQKFQFAQNNPGEHALVSNYFELPGKQANVQVEIRTDLANDWAYFNMALINEQSGQGFDFGREVSHFSGTDSDGIWSEGDQADKVILPRVPAGRYYLRIEPDMDTQTPSRLTAGRSMAYEVIVRRDVPSLWLLFLVLPLLIVPPIVTSARSAAFEGRRWMESDYAPSSSSSDD